MSISAMTTQSPNARQHILACLARLDLLIRREVINYHLRHPHRGDEKFRGLYISEEDLKELLASPFDTTSILSSQVPKNDGIATLEAAITALTTHIQDIENVCQRSGEFLPLLAITQQFGLSDFERDALVICMAAEIDLKYERLYAYLQD